MLVWSVAFGSSSWRPPPPPLTAMTLRPGTTDALVYQETFEGLYHLPPEWMPDPETVLDLGANIGLVGLHYQMIWPRARVVMVEMDALNARQALRNNPGGLVLHEAVGPRTQVGYYKRGGDQYAYRLNYSSGTRVMVEALGQLIDRIFKGRVDFVKMDIEGTEWELF